MDVWAADLDEGYGARLELASRSALAATRKTRYAVPIRDVSRLLTVFWCAGDEACVCIAELAVYCILLPAAAARKARLRESDLHKQYARLTVSGR
jgi:hypothetical protein